MVFALDNLRFYRGQCLQEENENSARSFLPEAFAPPWRHGRPCIRLMDVRAQMLVFPRFKFEGLPEGFDPGRPSE